jgi:NAD(P)-dependent dehydrogenase (short-subunit alcohol dehydrogenase family)/uncharacterized OB-fold protein
MISKRNPLQRIRVPVLPPASRSRATHGLTAAAALGRFRLQVCAACGKVQYPPRDVCGGCLSNRLGWRDLPDTGDLIAGSVTLVSHAPYYRERAPWRIGTVRLDIGPSVIANVHRECPSRGPVRVAMMLDKAGAPVLFALPREYTSTVPDDPQYREMIADPKGRRVLVSDGNSAVGRAIAKSLLDAGAARVFLGIAEPWKVADAADSGDKRVERLDLDITIEDSVRAAAAAIGGLVEIVVNTADFVRPGGIMSLPSFQDQRVMDDVIHLGLVRLARAFGPALMARGSDGDHGAVAWVNILSVFALAPSASYGAYSATHAAALSAARSLRSELRAGGIRVLNLFTGPTETEWFQELPPPKVTPNQIGSAVAAGLSRGLEEIAVGDVANDLVERLLDNPKAAEREARADGERT